MAATDLLLNLAHRYLGEPDGNIGLLQIVASLVILALGGALLLVQPLDPPGFGAGEAQVALPFAQLGAGLIQREAQQLIPFVDPAAKVGDPRHPAAHFDAEGSLLTTRHRAADPDASGRIPPGHIGQSDHLLLCQSRPDSAQQGGPGDHPCPFLSHR